MLLELDPTTLTYLNFALEHVCKKIPPGMDSRELRKQIADAMTASAKAGQRTFSDFEKAGLDVLTRRIRSKKRWFAGLFRP
jgi:hypothetical protein